MTTGPDMTVPGCERLPVPEVLGDCCRAAIRDCLLATSLGDRLLCPECRRLIIVGRDGRWTRSLPDVRMPPASPKS